MNIKQKIKDLIFKFFSLFTLDEYSIVIESEGDCCDNSYAIFDYIKQNGYLSKYKITWLVTHPERFIKERNVDYLLKSLKSLKTIKRLMTSKYYIYDHCNLMASQKKRKGQKIINLWHGCGVKASKYYLGKSNIDILISTSVFFNEELSKVFGVNIEQIKPLGYPRSDYFFKPLNSYQNKVKQDFEQYQKVILWMPTFRRSVNKTLDESYFNSYTGLPIIENEEELLNFDNYLNKKNTLCIFKIHHLQAQLTALKHNFKNIRIINDKDIYEMGLQLYQYIMLTDFLITDYSSIATDFMLLNRPIIYTIDDYDQYKESRGFSFDNAIQYFAGYRVKTIDEFYKSIEMVLAGKDIYKEERNKINNLFNCHQDGHNCQKILQIIGINPKE